MNLELLTRPTGWYGKYSGYYEQLPRYLQSEGRVSRVLAPHNSIFNRVAGKCIALARGIPPRDQSVTWSEFIFERRMRSAERFGHVLSFESHEELFRNPPASFNRVCATLHLPPDLLNDSQRESISNLSAGIVLYQRDLEFFEKRMGIGRVRFVPHGIDTDFFRPAQIPPDHSVLRMAYVGQFGRHTTQASRVIAQLLILQPDLYFDMVLAKEAFRSHDFEAIANHPRVIWHFGIPDSKLLSIYQSARALFLPLLASGANNAIVESLACGLPVVTTDVGGIRDYGGGSLFPLAPPENDNALIELALHWLEDTNDWITTSKKLRNFAEARLQWSDCAQAHLHAYRNFFA
ncbi:MAG: hypothetical protein SynsKO_12980 [Synoicihabitans sp.]